MIPSPNLSPARLIAILTPVLLLGGALGSQYIGGLYPCEMCMWQRWPHLIAIFFALDAIALRNRPPLSALFAGLAALAIAISGAIGAFHAGVEYGWWEGFTACSTPAAGGSAADMLDTIMKAPLTRCDTAPWSLFGISLAGYNAIFSLGAAALVAALLFRWNKETA
ncbi:MAG: disulfide bond formation protein B [Sphingobium sp.]